MSNLGLQKMATVKTPKQGTQTSTPAKPAQVRPARAELIWEGKYDADGKRVAPLRVALPFQTVETVNELAQDRQQAAFSSARVFARRRGVTG